jgi:hypothetical protein
LGETLTTEQAMVLVANVVQFFREHAADRATLAAISAGIRRLVA